MELNRSNTFFRVSLFSFGTAEQLPSIDTFKGQLGDSTCETMFRSSIHV